MKHSCAKGAYSFLVACAIVSVAQAQSYNEVSAAKGVNHAYGSGFYGGGASFYDFNNDGWDDITLATYTNDTIHFYQNNNGTFQKLDPPLVHYSGFVKHITWVDYDNDGDKDLYVASFNNGNVLYQNDGNMNFTDVTVAAGLSVDIMPTNGVCWADINNDGWLDLYVTNYAGFTWPHHNYLYKSNGNGTFTEVSVSANVPIYNHSPWLAGFLEIDNDGWPDLYIPMDRKEGNKMFRNLGDETFDHVTGDAGTGVQMDAMGIAMGDLDNNGYLDVYMSNKPQGHILYMNNGDGTYNEEADARGVAVYEVGWGTNCFDYDNDGDLDLYVSGMMPGAGNKTSKLFQNDGTANFVEPAAGLVADTVESYSNAVGDFNNDGYCDMVVLNKVPFNSQLWENTGGSNNWLKVGLQGTASNRDGVGAWIDVYANGMSYSRYTHCGIGYLAQNSGTEILGLGNNTTIDSVIVRWPSGIEDRFTNVSTNQKIMVIEGSTTNVDEVEDITRLSLFPNPASEQVVVRFNLLNSTHLTIELTNVMGQIVWSTNYFAQRHQNMLEVDVDALATGVYLMTVKSDKSSVTQQIVVE